MVLRGEPKEVFGEHLSVGLRLSEQRGEWDGDLVVAELDGYLDSCPSIVTSPTLKDVTLSRENRMHRQAFPGPLTWRCLAGKYKWSKNDCWGLLPTTLGLSIAEGASDTNGTTPGNRLPTRTTGFRTRLLWFVGRYS